VAPTGTMVTTLQARPRARHYRAPQRLPRGHADLPSATVSQAALSNLLGIGLANRGSLDSPGKGPSARCEPSLLANADAYRRARPRPARGARFCAARTRRIRRCGLLKFALDGSKIERSR
jgi:hypothetical protein